MEQGDEVNFLPCALQCLCIHWFFTFFNKWPPLIWISCAGHRSGHLRWALRETQSSCATRSFSWLWLHASRATELEDCTELGLYGDLQLLPCCKLKTLGFLSSLERALQLQQSSFCCFNIIFQRTWSNPFLS